MTMVAYTVKPNPAYRNAHEIYFESKPEANVIEALKAMRFRWNVYKHCWYGFHNESEIATAIGEPKQEKPIPVRHRRSERKHDNVTVDNTPTDYTPKHGIVEKPVVKPVEAKPVEEKKTVTLYAYDKDERERKQYEYIKQIAGTFGIDENCHNASIHYNKNIPGLMACGAYLTMCVAINSGTSSKVNINIDKCVHMNAGSFNNFISNILSINPMRKEIAHFLQCYIASISTKNEKEIKLLQNNNAKLEKFLQKCK